tara:strand:+ start:2483 stop:2770 length:288 start_codon:yes stop_codon:yes gene_type:complete
VPSEYDPMVETNAAFFDMVNQEDWDFNYARETEIFDIDTDENFFPVVYEYMIPGPMPGVFIKISMALRDEQQKVDFLEFINNLGGFLNEEDEKYG